MAFLHWFSAWLAAHKDPATALGALLTGGSAVFATVTAFRWAKRYRTQKIIELSAQAAVDVVGATNGYLVAARQFALKRSEDPVGIVEFNAAQAKARLFFGIEVLGVLAEVESQVTNMLRAVLALPLESLLIEDDDSKATREKRLSLVRDFVARSGGLLDDLSKELRREIGQPAAIPPLRWRTRARLWWAAVRSGRKATLPPARVTTGPGGSPDP